MRTAWKTLSGRGGLPPSSPMKGSAGSSGSGRGGERRTGPAALTRLSFVASSASRPAQKSMSTTDLFEVPSQSSPRPSSRHWSIG